FDIFARQYELARADEAKEGPVIQVIDAAEKPERKSRPKRGLSAMLATLAAAFLFGSLHLRRLRQG
ncbi:MAG TPA: lipopolysaccharide biosynthesis protein, partial [Burkholderiaceae bacterium]|nr:lipopolysaccharide biosynthesis protein [Burkholderiaceae bacterium]